MRIPLFIVALTFLLASCAKPLESDVSSQSIWTYYEAQYDENEQTITAFAHFKFESGFGERLQLSSPAKVSYNNIDLDWHALDAGYENYIGAFLTDGEFVYSDLEGNVYNNMIEFHEVNFPAGIDSVSRYDIFDFDWIGEPLGENETLFLTIDNIGNSADYTWTLNDVGEDHFSLGIDELQELEDGWATWSMIRRYTPVLQDSTLSGGRIRSVYIPQTIQVYMK